MSCSEQSCPQENGAIDNGAAKTTDTAAAAAPRRMQIEMVEEEFRNWKRREISRDCYISIDGERPCGYTKEGEFADTIRYFLLENPHGEIIIRNSTKWKEVLLGHRKYDGEEEEEEEEQQNGKDDTEEEQDDEEEEDDESEYEEDEEEDEEKTDDE